MVSGKMKYTAFLAVSLAAAGGIYLYISRHAQPNPAQLRGAIGQDVDTSVLTGNYDLSRTNAYLAESILTPANVRPASFGKAFTLPLDGQIYAQPLYLPPAFCQLSPIYGLSYGK